MLGTPGRGLTCDPSSNPQTQPMVTLDELEAFDLQTWLCDPELAAACMHCHPSTISRRSATVVDTFQLIKDGQRGYVARHHDWQLILQQQRQVHQHYRMMCRMRLRLHLHGAMDAATDAPRGWLAPAPYNRGRMRQLNSPAIRQLISQRVVDAAWVDGHLVVLPDLSDWSAVVELRQWLNQSQSIRARTSRGPQHRQSSGPRMQAANREGVVHGA